MLNFWSANQYKLNENILKFQNALTESLRDKFCHNNFQTVFVLSSTEQPLTLNNIGLKFLKIQPQTLQNGEWRYDKNWDWNANIKELIAKVCSDIADKFDFEFLEIHSDCDNNPLFVIRVAEDSIKDILY